MKKNNKLFENPCYGHRCGEYKYAEVLLTKIKEITEGRKAGTAFPFLKVLRRLGILPSTLDHGKKCRPLNGKLMEGVKLFCDETIFDTICEDKRLILEYTKIMKPKVEKEDDNNKPEQEKN